VSANRPLTSLLALLVLTLAAVGLVWTGVFVVAPRYSMPTLKLGLVAPLSGEPAAEGYRWVFAAKQAVAAWNSTAPLAFQMELVVHDEGDGVAAARRLVADPQVVGVIGHWRPDAAADSWPVYAAAGLPVLALNYGGCDPAGAAPVLCMAPTRDELATAATSYLIKQAGASASVALVAGPDIGDLAVAEAVRAAATRAGLRVVRAEAALPYATAFADVARRLATEPYDALVFTGSLAASQAFERDLRPLGSTLRLYLPHRGGLEAPGAPAGGWLSPFAEPNTQAYAAFRTAFSEAWGQPSSLQAAAVYDGARILLDALQRVPGDGRPGRTHMAGALRRFAGFQGVLGDYTLNGQRLLAGAGPGVRTRVGG